MRAMTCLGLVGILAIAAFVGRGRGEIYAYGFRNPYRCFSAADPMTVPMAPAGAVYAAIPGPATGTWTSETIAFSGQPNGAVGHYVLGFGQDGRGEVYVLTTDNTGTTGSPGRVYRLANATAP